MPPTILAVRVTPKASSNRVVEENGTYRVYTTTVPEDGKANQAVLTLLAKYLGVAKSSLTVLRGQTSRDKLISLE